MNLQDSNQHCDLSRKHRSNHLHIKPVKVEFMADMLHWRCTYKVASERTMGSVSMKVQLWGRAIKPENRLYFILHLQVKVHLEMTRGKSKQGQSAHKKSAKICSC